MARMVFIGAGSTAFAKNLMDNTPGIGGTMRALCNIREHIYHAAMLDPHTAAEPSLKEIHARVDELIDAHGDMLPAYHWRRKPVT